MNNEVFNWDSTIEDDGKSGQIITLPEGDYTFTVDKFERGSFKGSEKIPACPQADVTLSVKTDDGTAKVFVHLQLAKIVEWKLTSFFRCVGLKKRGEPLVMDWSKTIGREGRAHIKPREYDKDGKKCYSNDLDYFIDASDAPAAAPVKEDTFGNGDLPF